MPESPGHSDSHALNRASWDRVASFWQRNVYTTRWKTAPSEPHTILMEEEREHLGDLQSKSVCVLGTGNGTRDFALAGLGAHVTSVDISQGQLDHAARKAEHLGLRIRFLRADVEELSALGDQTFDAVYSSYHVATWLRDLSRFVAEGARILKDGGVLLINEVHPAARLSELIADGHPSAAYFDRGPYELDRSSETDAPSESRLVAHEFLWTVEDYVMAILGAGCRLTALLEYEEPRLHRGSLRAWRERLPRHLLLAARKTAG